MPTTIPLSTVHLLIAETGVRALDQNEFTALTAAIFEQSDAGSGNLLDRYNFTNDGVLAVCSEETGRVGFGIASDMSPSPELVEKIGDLNRLMQFGHYWLSRGADDDHWVLVFGMKFPYEVVSRDHVIELVAALTQHHGAISESVRNHLGDTPHRAYTVDASSPDASALVLMGHLA